MPTTARNDRMNDDPDVSWPRWTSGSDGNIDPSPHQVRGVHVNARRWFQPTYGNTYHTVSVVVTYLNNRDETWQVTVGPSGVTYGYGDHFVHTVGVMLTAVGFYDGDPYDVRRDHRDVWTQDVVDVQRRGDLH